MKPVWQAYQVQRFGRGGFVDLAERTGTPIVPVAIVGAEEVHPAITVSKRLASMVRMIFPTQRVEEIAVFPIHVAFPNLDDASWEIHAQFKALPDGIDAILGHAGFLGRMTATFVEGKEFELSDIRR